MPFIRLVSSRTLQTIANVQVRDEFLAANGTEACYESYVGYLVADLVDFASILFPIFIRPAQLFQCLGALIKRHSGSIRGRCYTAKSAPSRPALDSIDCVRFRAGQGSILDLDSFLLCLKQ